VAARKRNIKKRLTTLDSDAQKWLEGQPCGFFKFKHDDELAALFEEHGDTDSMFWRRGMSLPITLEDLESREAAWLGSGDNDEYGFNSYFIDKHYSDEQKKELWESRGDKKRFQWRHGMRRPEPIGS
jgi:hypothetical protein